MDWSWLVEFKVSPLELIARGSALYWFLFLVFRFVLRRDVGGIGVADVLLVVLIADASQNAMTGGYTSVAEGCDPGGDAGRMELPARLGGVSLALGRALVEPRPLPLIRAGRILHREPARRVHHPRGAARSPAPERHRVGARGATTPAWKATAT